MTGPSAVVIVKSIVPADSRIMVLTLYMYREK